MTEGEDKKPVFTFKGMFNTGRTLRGDLSRIGHYLGLYPDDPNRFLGKSPETSTENRNEHFEVGSTEHLASVTSLEDFKSKKAARKPEGY